MRLFNAADLHAMLNAESLALIAERGMRVLADYLPPRISRSSEYARIFELERKLGRRPKVRSHRALHSPHSPPCGRCQRGLHMSDPSL